MFKKELWNVRYPKWRGPVASCSVSVLAFSFWDRMNPSFSQGFWTAELIFLCEWLASFGKHTTGRGETKNGFVLIVGFEGVILYKTWNWRNGMFSNWIWPCSMVALMVRVLTSELSYSTFLQGYRSILYKSHLFLTVTLGFSNSEFFTLLLFIFSYWTILLLTLHEVSEFMGGVMHGDG